MTGIDYPALIQAALQRYFPDPEEREYAASLLEEYGDAPHEREAARVRAAMLKLAGPSLERLEQELARARQDYRDVLAAAEYPRQLREGANATNGPAAKAHSAQEDLAQYRNWVESFGLAP